MKRLRVLVGTVALAFLMSVAAFADSAMKVIHFGQAIQYSVQPIMADGDILLEVRPTYEALDYTVQWDAANQKVKIVSGYADDVYELTVGSKTMYVQGKAVTLKTAPRMENGKLMAPLSSITTGIGIGAIYYKQENELDLGVATSMDERFLVQESRETLAKENEAVRQAQAAQDANWTPSESDYMLAQTETQAGLEMQKKIENSKKSEQEQFLDEWIMDDFLIHQYGLKPFVGKSKDGNLSILVFDTNSGKEPEPIVLEISGGKMYGNEFPESETRVGTVRTKFMPYSQNLVWAGRYYNIRELFAAINDYSGLNLIPMQDHPVFQAYIKQIEKEWISEAELRKDYGIRVHDIGNKLELRKGTDSSDTILARDNVPDKGWGEWPNEPIDLNGLGAWYIQEINVEGQNYKLNELYFRRSDLERLNVI